MFDIGVKSDIHTESFRDAASTDIAHENALRVMKALAMTGIECILDNELLCRVRKEFESSK